MNKIVIFVLATVLVGLIGEGFGHSLRVRREGDEEVIEQIKQHVTRLRHAESRLKKFTDQIETGLETGLVKTALAETEDKTEKGQVDFFKLVKAFKEHTPNSFEDLIKRVADDTHILMDQLYGRLNELGTIVEGAKHDEADTSAEEHHSKA
ncbi:unnamed protein product [Allacma fusca]|uniref:Uncharacterized protein n=1 Tax=Allacma fusca TaxID=39272 RepID=A0A8J2KRR0_9HEXA|nr:unnamed protein product [Allacma fusca]